MAGVQTKKRIIIPAVAVLMAALISLVWGGVTYGWFDAVRDTPPETVNFGNSEAYAIVTFVDEYNQEHTLSTTDVDEDNELIYNPADSSFSVDLFTPTALNYFGKMRMRVFFRGTTETCIRVIYTEEWKDASGKIMRQALTPYGADGSGVGDNSGINSSLWIDLRRNDSIFYYSDISDPVNGWRISSPKVGGVVQQRSLPIITKGPVFTEPLAGVTMRIGIRVESVQFNRYREIWGITSYPTR